MNDGIHGSSVRFSYFENACGYAKATRTTLPAPITQRGPAQSAPELELAPAPEPKSEFESEPVTEQAHENREEWPCT
jgi:hypothetical protein